jgi:acetyl-CoA C-acetyltransferase
MRIDPNPARPVIVGVGRHTQRTHEGAPYLEPAALLAAAVRAAMDDAAPADSGASARKIGSVRLVRSLSTQRYRNAPLLIAQMAGLEADEYVEVSGGGESPGAALARACAEIAAGTYQSVLLVSGEAWFSQTQAERAGESLSLTEQPLDTAAPASHGSLIEFVHPAERALGIVRPIQEYPLFEQALRVVEGRSLAEHQRHLGAFVERLSQAAQRNPYAWDQRVHTADEIAVATPANRYVGFPYTKLMVSDEQVDMAASVLVTSVGQARSWGVAPEQLVYPLVAASGEAPPISERVELHDSVLSREVGRSIDARSGQSCREATYVDLYSCFPSAVQIQARELGIDDGRALSLTGGMRFSGGPWCGYAMQGFAATVEAVRAEPGALGLVSANGGAITKLVVTLLSTEPTPEFSCASAQPAIDATPRREVTERYDGPARIESYTVMHGRGGVPLNAVLACRTPAEQRVWGIINDPAVASTMTVDDAIGVQVGLRADGSASL